MRDKIIAYMEENNITVSQMARQLGVSRQMLHLYLSGKTVKSNVVEKRARDFFDKKEGDIPKWQIVKTDQFKAIMGLCELAYQDGDIAVVIGEAGLGKTIALTEYARRNPYKSLYIKCDVTFTARELLIEIGEKLGIAVSGTVRNMMREIERVLRTSRRVLLVDEADLLTIKQIEILRAIHDSTQCGLVLAGLPRLKLLLLKGPQMKDNLAQLYSRVGMLFRCKMPEEREIKFILDSLRIKYNGNFIKELLPHIRERGLRGMAKVVSKALIHAKGTERKVLDGKDIDAVRQYILGGVV
jgi:hypothetical protein